MIDLNLKREKKESEPVGLVILTVLPFCAMIIFGVIHAL